MDLVLKPEERVILQQGVTTSSVSEICLKCHTHLWGEDTSRLESMFVWLKINGVGSPVLANEFREADNGHARPRRAATLPLGKPVPTIAKPNLTI